MRNFVIRFLICLAALLSAPCFGQGIQPGNLPSATIPISSSDFLMLSQSGSLRKVTAGTLLSQGLYACKPSTLGGLFSTTGVTSQWVRYIDSTGTQIQSQPAFADISGTLPTSRLTGFLSPSQMPALTGDVVTQAGNIVATVATVNGVAYPTNPTIGTIPVVTGAHAITYQNVSTVLPTATAVVLGVVSPDGTTITNTAGAISVTYGTTAATAAQGNDTRITGPSGVTGAIKSNGSGVFGQAACGDLSNGATGCSTATGTSGATIPLLNGTNTWSGVQSVNSGNLALKGATSGTVTINAAAIAGSNTITLPAGTTDFSATGGTSQVVKQVTAGAPLTVGQLACSDLSGVGTGCTTTVGTIATQAANNVTITGGSITGMSTPSNPSDVAIKSYVDSVSSGLYFKNEVIAATTAALTASYLSGVLTNTGALAAFSIDGQTPGVGVRVLVKDMATSAYNGIYTVTTAGNGAVAWVLTRATDYNSAAQIVPGSVVPVVNGTVNGGSLWLQTATVVTVGVDNITFVEFVFPQGGVAITGGTINGTVIGGSTPAALTTSSLSLTGGVVRHVRRVIAAGAVTVATTDDIVDIAKTSGAATTVNLPATPTTGQAYVIKDAKFDAATNNITITPNAGNIDGASTYVIRSNGGSANIHYDGTQWLVN